MMTCWFLWKLRNSAIIKKDFQKLLNPHLMIKRLIRDIEDCNLEPLHRGHQVKKSVCIGWKRPQDGWIKLNSDFACKDMSILLGVVAFFVI